MSKPSIEVKNLSKRYIIQAHKKPDSLRDLLSRNPLFRNGHEKSQKEEIWALKNINFELRQGETLGIIGRNGAGKSTLLKILSRIVTPTSGKAIVRGKVASLLEVGTGFHPELTGRENVFFNGALLGMARAEIARKFNDIVEFSEVGKFIDTQVKRYSSGMRGRLAFSVAAHLDADIMIIDEVLSTGDIGFRKKALEKMKAAAFDGRSVLFVSHSMASIEDLCHRALYLQNGKQIKLGETKEVIEKYVGETNKRPQTSWAPDKNMATRDDRILPSGIHIVVNGKRSKKNLVNYSDKLEVELSVKIKNPTKAMSIGVSVFDGQDRRLFRAAHTDIAANLRPKLQDGLNRFRVEIPLNILKPGEITIALDCDIYKEGWIINPASTEAKVGFILREDAALMPTWDFQREGLIKPRPNWHKL